MTEGAEDSSERFYVTLPIDDYDDTAGIHPRAFEREIRRIEERNRSRTNRDRREAFDLSRFAVVDSEPTDEKWDELAKVEENGD